MSDADSPRSRPLHELEPEPVMELGTEDPSPHSLPIEATLPASDPKISGPGDAALPARRGWGRRLFMAGVSLTVGGAAAALLDAIVRDALAGNDWIAWAIAGGLALAAAGVLVGLVREWLALESLDGLRRARVDAEDAEEDPEKANATLKHLRHFYRGRPDLEWAWAQVEEQRRSGVEGISLVHLADRLVLAPLDARAERIATAAVRRAAAVAAISPFPLADMAVSLIVIATMLRRMLRLYGGRPGLLATWRLLRMSFAYVLASGALEFADDTIGDVLGVGIASRLSRRVGTGLVNGLLTARIAVAAMNLIRPFPPHRTLPSPRGLLARAAVDLRRSDR